MRASSHDDAANPATSTASTTAETTVQRGGCPMRASMNAATATLRTATANAVRTSPRYGSRRNGKRSEAASAPK